MGLYEAGWQVGAVVGKSTWRDADASMGLTATFSGFWINYGINQTIPYGNVQWRISFAVQLIPSGLLGIGCIFLLESPRWRESLLPLEALRLTIFESQLHQRTETLWLSNISPPFEDLTQNTPTSSQRSQTFSMLSKRTERCAAPDLRVL